MKRTELVCKQTSLRKEFFVLLQFRWFQIEVLQAMEKNVQLDEEYIDVSSGGRQAALLLPLLDILHSCKCSEDFLLVEAADVCSQFSKQLWLHEDKTRCNDPKNR